MLTKIWVDGFRSLNDFTFEPKQGLNVLVGANGAGKTNIIDFLKFVSLLKNNSLADSVKKTGEIFTRFYEKKEIIKLRMNGTRYGYYGEINFNDNKIVFDEQEIKSNINFTYTIKCGISPAILSNGNDDYIRNFETPYNFNPSIIKQFDKIGSEPVITSEGEGLHAFLYSLQSNPKKENLLKKIQTHFSYLRNDIVKFEVEKNDILNRFITYAFFKKGEGSIKLPISHLSDGTVKWLAMVAAIMSCQNDFIIDEPENFIHPELHSLMIELLRERMEETGGIAVIATHSETILNAVKPEEMIVVTMDEGKTKAMPIENAEHFQKVINETNFGMGHIYLTGWLK